MSDFHPIGSPDLKWIMRIDFESVLNNVRSCLGLIEKPLALQHDQISMIVFGRWVLQSWTEILWINKITYQIHQVVKNLLMILSPLLSPNLESSVSSKSHLDLRPDKRGMAQDPIIEISYLVRGRDRKPISATIVLHSAWHWSFPSIPRQWR